jgi:hypothetical protein
MMPLQPTKPVLNAIVSVELVACALPPHAGKTDEALTVSRCKMDVALVASEETKVELGDEMVIELTTQVVACLPDT